MISENATLTSLTGLDNVTSIGGVLFISENPALTSLTGLDNVTSIGGNLWIRENAVLTSLTGLDNLITIWGNLFIEDTEALTSLTGLDNVTSVGNLLIWNNASLISLAGLESITFIEADIAIGNSYYGGNPSLTSLTGLDNLTSIGGDFYIERNAALTNLTGLDNLTSIGGGFCIYNNAALTSLTGLDSIDAGSIDDLYICDNNSLSTCEVQSVCDYLASPNGGISIHDNDSGCNSQAEVEAACEAGWVPNINFESEFSIYPNPAKKEIFISSKNGAIIKEVNIYNQIGHKVLYEKIITNTIDVSMLQQGMYIIELVLNESKIREKLTIR